MENSQDLQINQVNTCKHCGSNATVKFGTYKGVQRYWCKACKKKFIPNDHLFKMKTPYYQVSSAIDDYYKGDSINEIRDHIHTRYQTSIPSSKSVYGWITKYTEEATKQFKDYHPQVGGIWVCDETVLKIGGKKYWCIAIIDKDTRFLLETKLSINREKNDIKILMEHARDRANRTPDKVLTDGWGGYRDGIELAFGADAKHIVTEPFAGAEKDNTELIERWNGTLKDRTKSLRGLKNIESANQFLDGFLAWYNFMRPHESLDGKTPAEEAKVQYSIKSWADVVRVASPQIEILQTPAKVDILSKRQLLARPVTHRNYNYERKAKLRISARSKRVTPKTPKLADQHYSKRGGGLTRRGDI